MEWAYAWQQQDIADLQYSSQKVRNSIHIQGKKISLKKTPLKTERRKPAKRGSVKAYSPGSRRRLLDWISRVDWSLVPQGMFITLTYPDEVADVDMKATTDQRNYVHQAAERHVGEKIPMIWRREFVPRKSGKYQKIYVQHFHLCMFTQLINSVATWKGWWRKAIGWDKDVQVHSLPMPGQKAAFYMAKYLSKTDEQSGILEDVSYLNKPGRAWGIRRKELIKLCPSEDFVNITDEQYDAIMEQTLCLCPKAVEFGMESFTLYGDKATEAAKVVREILY